MPETTLEEYVKKVVKDERDTHKVLKKLYESVERGEIELKDPNPPTTFLNYLLRLDYSLWFWTVVSLIALTLLFIKITPLAPWSKPLRYVFGTIYVLFIPGYVLIEALYPRENDLKPLERMALSIGLSLAVVPLIGLMLNYTPWGIRLSPIIISTSTYSIALLIIAAYRKYRLCLLRLAKHAHEHTNKRRAFRY